MRKLVVLLAVAVNLLSVTALAQTVNSTRTVAATAFNSTVLNGATLTTGTLTVSNYASVAFNVVYTRSGGAASAINMTCQTCPHIPIDGFCDGNTTGYDVDVIVATAATGVSTTIRSTWSRAVSATAAWTFVVSNLTAPYIYCSFTGTGSNAGDFLAVNYTKITP